jgi:hypothetical protein
MSTKTIVYNELENQLAASQPADYLAQAEQGWDSLAEAIAAGDAAVAADAVTGLDLDGYASIQTVDEHYQQHSAAINTITKGLDGYASDQSLQELKSDHSIDIKAITDSLDATDGYLLTDGSRVMISALDMDGNDINNIGDLQVTGTISNTGITNLITTVDEHYTQHSEAINTITKDLDGYLLNTTDTLTGELTIVGDTDTTHLIVKANSTQSNTNPIVVLQDSAGNPICSLHSDAEQNVFLGRYTGRVNAPSGGTNGLFNTFLSARAGYNNTSGYHNMYIGYEAGNYNQTGAYNICVGSSAGRGASGNSYSYNTLLGAYAGYAITTGNWNLFQAFQSGYSNTTGVANLGLGYRTLFYNQTGEHNIAIGYQSARGVSGQSCSYNTFIGFQSGYGISTGNENTAIGYEAGKLLTTGEDNTLIGYKAGDNITTGYNNIIIGYDIDADDGTGKDQLSIGDVIKGDLSSGDIIISGNLTANDVDINEQLVGHDLAIQSITKDLDGYSYPAQDCHVETYRDSTQSIATNTYVDVIFDDESIDEGGDYDNSTGIFTAPSAGYYMVSWAIFLDDASFATGEYAFSLLSKNNSTASGSSWRGEFTEVNNTNTTYLNSVGSLPIKLAANDTLRIKVYHVQGGAVNLAALGNGNYFHVSSFK